MAAGCYTELLARHLCAREGIDVSLRVEPNVTYAYIPDRKRRLKFGRHQRFDGGFLSVTGEKKEQGNE